VNFDLQPLWLTAKIAMGSTVILLVICLPLALWIGKGRTALRTLVRTSCNLPLVLPPTVLGFALLLLFSPAFGPGRFLSERIRFEVLFTAKALLIGSVVGGLPFMLGPLVSGVEGLSPSLSEASRVLGKGRLETCIRVLLPALRPSILAGVATTFAHACGEFGVVLMVGGKIPGTTRTASIALYDAVEAMDFGLAAKYAAMLAVLSMAVLLLVERRLAGKTGAP
jgi:molybdate transport system permease protein